MLNLSLALVFRPAPPMGAHGCNLFPLGQPLQALPLLLQSFHTVCLWFLQVHPLGLVWGPEMLARLSA